jgi:septum formation protein
MSGQPPFPWRLSAPLLLASASQVRRSLLTAAGIPLEVMPSGLDERGLEAPLRQTGVGAPELAAHLARAKALAVSQQHPGRLVLGADQTLSCENLMLNKPNGRKGAEAQLRFLAGRTHRLHAAIALARDGTIVGAALDHARLTMRKLADEFIAAYLDSMGDNVNQTVGAYQLEGLGIHLFAKIEGDHSTILGLPMLSLLALLRQNNCLLD